MVNETHSILKELIENQDKKFSIRKISQLRDINYKSAYNAVSSLKKQGVINIERIGNIALCSFNKNFNSLVFSVEYARREDMIKNKNFKILYNRLKEINIPYVAILFGSYAKGSANKHSDIDILFIISDEEKETKIRNAVSLIPLNTHSTVISYKDFVSMAKSKEFSVVSEAIKKNVILVGIEEYYRLLENTKE